MSRKNNYIKSKANYTLFKKHLNTSKGIIYEQDYATIQPMVGLFDDDEISFSDSIFKFKVRKGNTSKKKHTRGNWAKWFDSKGNSGDTWQKNTIEAISSNLSSKIEIKPNYNSLSDFACYGSAIELVHASLNDIISKYPGSIILTDTCINLIKEPDASETIITIPNSVGEDISVKAYEVSNETYIDIDTLSLVNPNSVSNPMRFLSISIDKYTDKDGNPFDYNIIAKNNGTWCDGTIIAEVELCGVKIFVYYKDNKKILLSTTPKNEVLIKPKDNYLNEFFENLDDFEKILLNRESKPLYKAVFETPYTNENGYYYKNESYIWPKLSDNVSLDLSSPSYSMYVERLISLAAFHDNYDADVIWRYLTHESIKNLDWTFIRHKDNEIEDLSSIDSNRVEIITKLYGRQYDDIMRDINNIKSMSKISYDEKNNIPDYFLSDITSNSGWELRDISPISDNTIYTEPLYDGVSKGYNSKECNTAFLRRLKLNSAYINSLKGTRKGIETILGLFGLYKDEDFRISEYIAVAKPNSGNTYPDFETIENWNLKKDDSEDISSEMDYLYGLPLIRIMSGDNYDYVAPWFDKTKEYDGNMYFQMKGGWGKTNNKKIDLEISSIASISGNDIYSETLPYLKFADSISDMLSFTEDSINEGDICYVTNINGITDYSFENKETSANTSDFSHYFILETKLYSTILGYDNNSGCYGWKAIENSEFDGSESMTENGKKVLYLESIKSVENGNNPHCGYGKYDNGEEYLEYFRHIFKYSCENNKFSSVSDDDIQKIYSYGFDISQITDNKKCHFFIDSTSENHLVSINNSEEGFDEQFYNELFNPESLPKYDEAAANSIVNVKNIQIEFFLKTNLSEEIDYITNTILPYVEQMIPSTSIFTYVLLHNNT